MTAIASNIDRKASGEAWSVVVLYEDTATRERAMGVCDHLVRQFWAEVEFKFHWWRTDFLQDSGMAATAASNAAEADFIIFCTSADSELPAAVNAWLESWTERRGGREGVLIDLTEGGHVPKGRAQNKQMQLRQAARRAMMDYLTKLPSTITGTLPDSFETAAIRAEQVTSVLDDILHRPPPPPHYGLNE
jgi:hypothetical protein